MGSEASALREYAMRLGKQLGIVRKELLKMHEQDLATRGISLTWHQANLNHGNECSVCQAIKEAEDILKLIEQS